ncbi:hypothetical protein EVAR_68002_1 [Eumeta japonica]|uniref:Uncharacterized protein n=1 Tax=Eumeta variegata TaxID=151549 RepID=A0A4C1ZXU4_EUMVA|nr:hypothetical protein EVAR_68002_1 [Eumeta japonica]
MGLNVMWHGLGMRATFQYNLIRAKNLSRNGAVEISTRFLRGIESKKPDITQTEHMLEAIGELLQGFFGGYRRENRTPYRTLFHYDDILEEIGELCEWSFSRPMGLTLTA